MKVREEGSTYEDYASIPESAGRYELADGELWAMSPGPSTKHQFLSIQLAQQLFACEDDYLLLQAPIDVILSKHTTLQPDLILIRRDRLHIITARGVEGNPDLVVEILSPSTTKRDRGRKMELYAHYRVPEYWVVDSVNGSIEQYFLNEAHYELAEVFHDAQVVTSPHINCVSFTMASVLAKIPNLPTLE